MKNSKKADLYIITPPRVEDAGAFAASLEEAFAEHHVPVLQLRLKDAPKEHIADVAKRLLPVCAARDTIFLINDHVDIALDVGAHGVHLGGEDMSIARARDMLGAQAVIGASCYDSKHRAMEAGEQGADYIAFGAFYPTKTKENTARPHPDILRWAVTYTNLAVVAIGGIKPHNAAPLVEAGAEMIAVVSHIWEHEDGIKGALREWDEVFKRYCDASFSA